MKTYFVTTENIGDLQAALGRLIEYAKFLERETNRDVYGYGYVDTILDECEIEFHTEDS